MSTLQKRLEKLEPEAKGAVWEMFYASQLDPLLDRYVPDEVLEALVNWDVTGERFTELLRSIPDGPALVEWFNAWSGDPEEEAPWEAAYWPTSVPAAPVEVTEGFLDDLATRSGSTAADTDEDLTAATVLYVAVCAYALQQFKAHTN